MARLILSVLLLALALVVLLLGYLHFADLNKYNALLEAKIAEATGRAFNLEEMDLEVWPALRFTAHGVSLASPDGGSEPQMLQLGTLIAAVKPASLLFGPPQIESIALEGVVLLLETDASGDLNWNLSKTAGGAGEGSSETQGESDSSGLMPVKLGKITVRKLLVKRRQPGKPEQQLVVNDLMIKPEAAGVFELSGSGKVQSLVFDVAAGVALSREEVSINPMQLRIGSSDITGSIRLDSDDFRVTQVDLASERLDLTELLGEEGAESTALEGTPTSHPGLAGGKAGYIFVDDPLPLEKLRRYAMEFRLAASELVSRTVTLENLNAAGSVLDGELNAGVEFDTPVGARSASRIRLKAVGDGAQLQASVNARELRLNIASGAGAQPEQIPPISLSLEVASSGGSPRALAAGSNGDLLVTIGQGRVDNKLVARVSGDILAALSAALNPFSKKDSYTTFECGVIKFSVEDGLATLDPMVLQGEKVTILADGTLDLNTEELDIKFNTQPREGIGVSADMFVTPFVALRGTLANPTVGANKTGALVAAGTGGLSLFLRGARDRLGGSRDHCKETLPSFTHPPLAGQ